MFVQAGHRIHEASRRKSKSTNFVPQTDKQARDGKYLNIRLAACRRARLTRSSVGRSGFLNFVHVQAQALISRN